MRARLPVVLTLAALAAGCQETFGNLAARASDEWTRTYPLAPGGELEIGNTNGRVEIEAVDAPSVEVRAERIARATTDVGARALLPRIHITEHATPERIAIETERITGVMIGASVEVRYHVRAPKSATVRATTTNGAVSVTGIGGPVAARTTNGSVTIREASGGIEARTTNGAVSVDVAAVGREPIDLKTTNGAVTIAVPRDAKAELVASCTNGGIVVSGLTLDEEEQSRRQLRARLNGGGAKIELTTVNGGIRIRAREAGSASADERR